MVVRTEARICACVLLNVSLRESMFSWMHGSIYACFYECAYPWWINTLLHARMIVCTHVILIEMCAFKLARMHAWAHTHACVYGRVCASMYAQFHGRTNDISMCKYIHARMSILVYILAHVRTSHICTHVFMRAYVRGCMRACSGVFMF